jgi:peptide/nickel transport system ATP-binding protein/oligopeptide transport system ATP-binding protein
MTGKALPLLEVTDLQTTFSMGRRSDVVAVDGVSFAVGAGETLAIVGESGSGKSVTSLSIMRLLPAGVGRVSRGSIQLRGRELTTLSEAEMRAVRGKDIGMIFQEPMTSLNPVHTIGHQIAEVVVRHEGLSRRAAHERSVDLLQLVGIPEPRRRADNYPHQMSGGMRQRAMIAMALACEPSLLIADEPTTALDVTIQAQILDLMKTLQDKLGMAIVFITHDLGVVAEVADRVVVMYAGQVVETGPVADIFERPRMVEHICDRVVVMYLGRIMEVAPSADLYSTPSHPYTQALLSAVPIPKPGQKRERVILKGDIPSPINPPSGCVFRTRCPRATAVCAECVPELKQVGPDRYAACHLTG